MSNLYILRNDLKRENSIPLISRQSIKNIIKAFKSKIDQKALSQVESNVYELLDTIETKRLASLYKSYVFDFKIIDSDVNYSYNDIEEAIRKNIGQTNKKTLEASTELMQDIVKYAVSPVDNIMDFHRDENDNLNIKRDLVLERFISILESQTYENVWSDIMKYPFDNQTHGIRKHLMFGVNASTGKSIILEAMGTLYEAASAFKPNRPENGFDAANWNADVIERFVVLLDDDDPNRAINEDYLKNFLSNNMPQQLARGGGARWSEIYYGSSVIALNTAPAFLKSPQNNKRVIFLKLTESIEDMFTQDELNHLHNLSPQEILGYVNEKPTQLYQWRNDWNDVIDDDSEKVIEYVRAKGWASMRELKLNFDVKTIKSAATNAGWKAKTFTMSGESVYGYRDSTGIIDQPYKVDQLTFAAFENIHAVIGERNFETLEEVKNDVLEYGKLPKEDQPLFSTAVYHDKLTKENLTGFVGVVIDIDGANAVDMNELERKIELTGLSAIAWETSSSSPASLRARVWFYRVGGELSEYAMLVKKLSAKIDEPFDRASLPTEHRFYIGGTNIRLINTSDVKDTPKTMSANNKRSLINTVKNAADGEREPKAYWALMVVKQETGDTDLMREIIEESGMREANKAKLMKQFEL